MDIFNLFKESEAKAKESKAKESEAKAQHAQAVEAKNITELQLLYASKSWQITAPLRWTVTQAKRLRAEGPKLRVKAFIKKVLRKVNHELLLRPALRKRVVRWSLKLNLHAILKSLLTKALLTQAQGQYQSLYPSKQYFPNQPADFQTLSPRARKVYVDLKQAIQHHQKESH